MLTTQEVARIYDTILSTPGMNDTVKIELRLPRRNVFVLAKVIERGLQAKPDEESSGILSLAATGSMQELDLVPTDLLSKAGLTEMNERLQDLKSQLTTDEKTRK